MLGRQYRVLVSPDKINDQKSTTNFTAASVSVLL